MEAFVLCQVSCDIMVDDLLQLQPSMPKMQKAGIASGSASLLPKLAYMH